MGPEEVAELLEIRNQIHILVNRLEQLPRHRSISLAVTKLEEGGLWIHDRISRP